MKTELILLGKRIDMASQPRRRRLVVLIYGTFAALMAAGWFLDHWGLLSSMLILLAVPYVSRTVFGGYGPHITGLIKPFLGNEVRARYDRTPNSLWSRLCRTTIPAITDQREFCSDEREVRRRDAAHEKAYRHLGIVISLTFLVAYLKSASLKAGIALRASSFDQLIYGMLIASLILFLTLPQAILLWTEPDLISGPEEEPAPATLSSAP